MTPTNQSATAEGGELSFPALWRVVWKYKLLIVPVTVVCGIVAVILALKAIPMYRAEVAVTEVSSSNVGAAGALASQLGGIASLVGVNLGTGGSSLQTQALLRSRKVVEEFVKRHGQLPELFPRAQQPPSLWFTVRQFRDSVLSIRDDKRGGLTIIAMTWSDPSVAARWANEFIALANELLRTRAMDESKASLAYLNRQVEQTNVLDLKRVLYNLIENEEKTLMLANARTEYAFAVVDPAVSPEERFSPRRTLMVLFGIALGLFISTLGAFAHNLWVEQRDAAEYSRRRHLHENNRAVAE